MAEKKEKRVASSREPSEEKGAKKRSFWNYSMPLYVGVLLLVLGIVAGFVFHAVFFPPKIILQKPEPQPVSFSFSFVFNPDCKLCSQQSSFELLLKQRKLLFDVKTVDAKTAEGQELIGKFGIDSFPTVVVNANDLSNADAALFATLQTKFPVKNSFLVLPEKDFMRETKIFSSYMLKEIPKGVSCTIPSGKALLWEYGDDLEKATSDSLPIVSKLWSDFNAGLEFDFKHLSLTPLAEKVAVIDACGKKAGIFPAYHRLLIEKFQTKQLQVWDWFTSRNLALEAGIQDINSFLSCIDTNQTLPMVAAKTGADAQSADAYGLRQIPSFVLDCQFVILNPEKLKENICLQHPELNSCEAQ